MSLNYSVIWVLPFNPCKNALSLDKIIFHYLNVQWSCCVSSTTCTWEEGLKKMLTKAPCAVPSGKALSILAWILSDNEKRSGGSEYKNKNSLRVVDTRQSCLQYKSGAPPWRLRRQQDQSLEANSESTSPSPPPPGWSPSLSPWTTASPSSSLSPWTISFSVENKSSSLCASLPNHSPKVVLSRVKGTLNQVQLKGPSVLQYSCLLWLVLLLNQLLNHDLSWHPSFIA